MRVCALRHRRTLPVFSACILSPRTSRRTRRLTTSAGISALSAIDGSPSASRRSMTCLHQELANAIAVCERPFKARRRECRIAHLARRQSGYGSAVEPSLVGARIVAIRIDPKTSERLSNLKNRGGWPHVPERRRWRADDDLRRARRHAERLARAGSCSRRYGSAKLVTVVSTRGFTSAVSVFDPMSRLPRRRLQRDDFDFRQPTPILPQPASRRHASAGREGRQPTDVTNPRHRCSPPIAALVEPACPHHVNQQAGTRRCRDVCHGCP